MTRHPNECNHDEGAAFEPLRTPANKHLHRCRHCGALAFKRTRPGQSKQKPGRLTMYRCRVKGCERPVIERKFGAGWQFLNGCLEHPVRPKK